MKMRVCLNICMVGLMFTRHCLVMLQAIHSANNGFASQLLGVAQGSVGAKEMHHVLRTLAPVACRAPAKFHELCTTLLRVTSVPSGRRGLF